MKSEETRVIIGPSPLTVSSVFRQYLSNGTNPQLLFEKVDDMTICASAVLYQTKLMSSSLSLQSRTIHLALSTPCVPISLNSLTFSLPQSSHLSPKYSIVCCVLVHFLEVPSLCPLIHSKPQEIPPKVAECTCPQLFILFDQSFFQNYFEHCSVYCYTVYCSPDEEEWEKLQSLCT